MQTKKLPCLHYLILLCIATSLMLATPASQASYRELHDVYKQLQPLLEKNTYGIPVYINSRDENDTMTGVIYGVIHHPYEMVSDSLLIPANWCEIAPQHLNIKACTYRLVNKHCQLDFYSGRKFYEKADDVYQLSYQFNIRKKNNNFIDIRLTATDGPAGTSNYQLKIQAIPLDKSRSFIYFNYSYQYNFITSMGMSTYLATLGRGKLGFSITGKDTQDKPIYVDGVRGIIERNSVRYYLAIQSYLDTLHIKPEDRFNARINKWFDLTEKYHLQLYEMDKKDYLQYKQQERLDQQRLQSLSNKRMAIDNKCKSPGQ